MRLSFALTALASASAAHALQLGVHRLKAGHRHTHSRSLVSRANSDTLDLSTYQDMLYIANLTLAGQNYTMQLDTGSSDLWIKGASHPIPNTNTSSMTQNLTYGVGWAFGNIAWAHASFAGIDIASQAFLDVSSADNAVLSYDTDGVLGLGFNSLSTIDAAVNKSGGATGRNILYNLFYSDLSTNNYIAFSLQRASDSAADDVIGTFSIGELDSNYSSITQTPAIPTFPPSNPARWNVLLEALLLGNQTISVSTQVSGAPSNNAVVLLDSGSSYTYAPPDIVTAIYGNIPGASFDTDAQQWVVPCTAEIDLAFQINGQIYPMHPLDVVIKSPAAVNLCAGTFIPQASSTFNGVVDWIAGDNFLRSVYSLYDFGDFNSNNQMGNPYVKLLSLIDPNGASAEFAKARGTTPRTNITYNAASSSSTGSTTVSLSDSLTTTLNKINTYMFPVLALIAFNSLAIMVLLIGAGIWLCRRRRGARAEIGSVRQRKNKGRQTPSPLPLEPMQIQTQAAMRDSTATYLDTSYVGSPSKGVYQPVSMALTEDTFVPPSPAFSKYGDGGFHKGMDRPHSFA